MLIFKTAEKRYITPVSKWLKIKQKNVTKRSKYFDYSCDGDLWYCMFGKMLVPISSLEQFSYPEFFTDENGEKTWLSSGYVISNAISFGVEMDVDCEYVRFFKYLDATDTEVKNAFPDD
jgi:hypothetical protein